MRTFTRPQFGSLLGTLLVCLSAALILSSCKKTPAQKILGQWDVDGGKSVVEYRKDGTVVTTLNGKSTTGKYRFIDESHLELEVSATQGTNVLTLLIPCAVAFHDNQAEVTATLPTRPGVPAASQTLHYTRLQ